MYEVVPSGDKADNALDGGNPIKVGGVARQTNRTAVLDGYRVDATYDDVGRQITNPYQVRDLIATASASLTTGTETTLFAGTAGEFHDLIHITCSNNSTAAVTVSIRDATGGGVVKTIDVGANTGTTVNFQVPYPQNTAAAAWTADIPDITGTTVTVEALFVKNV